MAEEQLVESKKNCQLTEEQREIRRHYDRQRMFRMTGEQRAHIRERRRIAQNMQRRIKMKQLKEQREASDSKNGSGDAHCHMGSPESDGRLHSGNEQSKGRVRLNWMRHQARLRNTEAVKRADAVRHMGGDQDEQDIHRNKDHGSTKQQEGASSRCIVESKRGMSPWKGRNRLSYIRHIARKVNTPQSGNMDFSM